MRILSLIVVEWSVKQKAFHIHKVEQMVKGNFINACVRGTSDYLPIGVFETETEADAFIEKVKPEIDKNYHD